jgi:hypothetical protein
MSSLPKCLHDVLVELVTVTLFMYYDSVILVMYELLLEFDQEY